MIGHMRTGIRILVIFVFCFYLSSCSEKNKKANTTETTSKVVAEASKEKKPVEVRTEMPVGITVPKGMVWVPGKVFMQGVVAQDKMAMAHEGPAHKVAVDGFFIDATEVTNAQFKQFIDATNYKTVAERKIDWEEMKKQLPEGTPKPPDSIMQPGSLTFKKTKSTVQNLYDFSQWWEWTIGANWKHPKGPGSSIAGKENHPVVHISYEDALAYCDWAGRRLPTEAEWELAARGDIENTIFFWGDDATELSQKVNAWEGEFPVTNTLEDGFEGTAPVKSYEANALGVYDMAGNVWEWTNDWYNSGYYSELAENKEIILNPTGATTAFNERDPYAKEKVIKGGSFLCSDSYCASYRVSARMASSLDSAQEHLGFRTVATVDMLQNDKVEIK